MMKKLERAYKRAMRKWLREFNENVPSHCWTIYYKGNLPPLDVCGLCTSLFKLSNKGCPCIRIGSDVVKKKVEAWIKKGVI